MQITGGYACGIRISVPKQGKIRPSTDFIRKSIFNRIARGIQFATVLDGFAGTGAYGIEALSRGAYHCIFVERNRTFIPNLQDNIKCVCKSLNRYPNQCTKIICTSMFTLKLPQDLSIDYIFLDPPYPLWKSNTHAILAILDRLGHQFPRAKLVLEFPSQLHWLPEQSWKPHYPLAPSGQVNEPQINVFYWGK